MFEKTKKFCDSFLDLGVPGFDLAVYKGGECILRYMNGYSDFENKIKMNGKEKYNVYSVNATEEAKKLGNSRVFNLIVLGVAAQHMDFTQQQWHTVIEKTVPPKTVEINKNAFNVGFQLVTE